MGARNMETNSHRHQTLQSKWQDSVINYMYTAINIPYDMPFWNLKYHFVAIFLTSQPIISQQI